MADVASYLGQGPLSFSMPGTSSRAALVASALAALREAGEEARLAMLAEAACFSADSGALLAAQADISLLALANLDAAALGSLQALASLTASLPDPLGYLAALVQAVRNLLGLLLAGPPPLLPTIAATASINLQIGAEIAALRLSIAALGEISISMSRCVILLLAAAEALRLAVQATSSGAAASEDLAGNLAASPAYALTYSGTLAGLGAALNSVTPGTGIGGATPVTVTLQVVRQSDAAALSAQSALLRAS